MPRTRARPHKSLAFGTMLEETDDILTTRHPIRQLLPLVGMGLMLAGLFWNSAPAAGAGGEPFAYQNDRRLAPSSSAPFTVVEPCCET
jgi:hypothetical protein